MISILAGLRRTGLRGRLAVCVAVLLVAGSLFGVPLGEDAEAAARPPVVGVGRGPGVAEYRAVPGSSPDASGTLPLTDERNPRPFETVSTGVEAEGPVELPAVESRQGGRGQLPEVSGTTVKPEEGFREVVSERTATAKVFENTEDGTRAVAFFSRPVHYRDGGGWSEIVTEVERGAGGRWKNSAGAIPVELAAHADAAELASVDLGGGRLVSWSLQGARRSVGVGRGAKVSYRAALPGVDVELEPSALGVKETLVLADRNAPDTYVFTLNLVGLQARLGDDGSVELMAPEGGDPVAVIPRGYMEDSSARREGRGEASGAVDYELRGSGARVDLVVRLSRAYLDDPARVYPVYADPSLEGWSPYVDDTYLVDGVTDNVSSAPTLRIGRHLVNGAQRDSRAFLRFMVGDVLNPPNMFVKSAELRLFTEQAGTTQCAGRGVGIYKVTSPWSATGSQYPGPGLSAEKDWAVVPGSSFSAGTCAPGWQYFRESLGTGANLKRWVQEWADNGASNHGLAVRVDPGSEVDAEAYKVFHSSEGPNPPVLWVEYAPYKADFLTVGSNWTVAPTSSQWGSILVEVKNVGHHTWPANGNVVLSYRRRGADGVTLVDDGARTSVPSAVAPGGTIGPLLLRVAPTPAGQHDFLFDVMADGEWVSETHPQSEVVGRTLPVAGAPIQLSAPLPVDLARIGANQVTLSVTASDPENRPLSYKFRVCDDAGDCQSSAARSESWWPVSLKWGRSYTWNVEVDNGLSMSTMNPWRRLSTFVPQPAERLGADVYSPLVGGVNPATGNLVFSNTDFAVGGLSRAAVTRTYNSRSSRVGSFGPGWSAPWDVNLTAEAGDQQLVTWADGRQDRFGRNPAQRVVDGAASSVDNSVHGSPAGSSTVATGGGAYGPLKVAPRSGHGDAYWFGANPGPDFVDANGNGGAYRTTYAYTGGKPTTITNGAGRAITLTWGANNRVSRIDGPPTANPADRKVWTYGYDAAGRLTSACNAAGATSDCTTYRYDSASRLDRVTLPEDNDTVEVSYNTDGSVKWREDGRSDRWQWTYATSGGNRTATVKDPEGRSSVRTYDALGRLVSERDQQDRTRSYAYDTGGFLGLVTDANGNRIELGNNGFGQVLHRRTTRAGSGAGAEQYTSYYAYDPVSGLMTSSSAAGSANENDPKYRTTYAYSSGRLAGSTTPPVAGGPAERTTTYTYSDNTAAFGGGTMPNGLLLSTRTPGGLVTSYSYDTKGDLRRVTNPAGMVVESSYDELGRMATSRQISDSYPSGLTTTYTYDENGQLDKVTEPGALNAVTGVTHTRRVDHDYDDNANLVKHTVSDTTGGDPARVTSWGYDDADRAVLVTTPDGAVTETGFDDLGNVTQVVSPSGAVTRYEYSDGGDLTRTIHGDFAEGANLLARDLVGNEATTSTRWVPGPNTTAYPSGVAWAGKRALGLTAAAAGAVTASVPTGDRVPVVAGRVYTAATWARVSAAGRVPSVTLRFYDASGTLLTQAAATGAGTTTEWDRLAASGTAPAGATRADVVVGVTNAAAGETARFDAVRVLVGPVRDVVTETRTYDPSGRVATTTDATGRTLRHAYFADDQLRSVTLVGFDDPDGTVRDVVLEAHTYDPAGRLASTTTGNGRSTVHYTYNEAGLVATERHDTGGLDRKAEYTYDADGRVTETKLTGAGSSVAEYRRSRYDSAGRLDKSTVVINGGADLDTRYTYDQRGLVRSVTEPRGTSSSDSVYTTNYTHDPLGQLTKVTLPPVMVEENGAAPTSTRPLREVAYDTFGSPTHQRDPRGARTTTSYDPAGRPVRVDLPAYTRPDGTVLSPFTTTAYDAGSQPTATTDPRGHTTVRAYDTLGRLVRRVDPPAGGAGAGTWEYSYDDAGRLVASIAPGGARTETSYDDRDRIRTATTVERYPAPASLTTRYGYDDLGPAVSVVTPAGSATATVVNRAGEPVEVTDPAGKKTTIAYDAAGRAKLTTDPLGRAHRSTYDTAGRLVASAALTPGGALLAEETYGYDKAGNPTSVTSPLGWATTSAYDALGRLTSRTEPLAAGASVVTTFGYDRNGNRTRVTDGNGRAVLSTYNPWNLPATVVEPTTTAHPAAGERTFTATYDQAGYDVRLDAPGGVSRVRVYDPLGRLTEETGAGAEAPTAARTLGYDPASRVVAASVPGGTQTFTWDDRGHLLGAAGPAGGASFTYDPDGRMTSRSDAAGTSTFTWDPRGLLGSATDPLTGATRTFAYDNASQLVGIDFGAGKAKQAFGYDQMGRLSSESLATASGSTLSSTVRGYDTASRLVSKTLGPAGVAGAGTHGYAYDRSGRLESWTAPSGAVTPYAFDGAGNRTRAGGSVFAYDERNRLVSESTVADGPVFTENWAGTDNNPWPATRWAAPATTSTKDVDLAGGEGRIWVSSTSAEAVATTTAVTDADVTLTYRFSSRSTASVLRVGLRAATDASYRLDVQSNSSTVKLQRRPAGQSATQIGSFTHNTNSAPQRLRFQVQGTTLRAKIWTAGTTEPAAWAIEVTDPTLTGPGTVMVGHSATSAANTAYVDDLELRNLNATPGAPLAAYTWTPRGTLATKTATGTPAETSVFDAFDRLAADAGGPITYDAFDRPATRGADTVAYAGLEPEPVAAGVTRYARTPNGAPLATTTGGAGLALLADAAHGDVTGTFDPAATTLASNIAYDPYGNTIAATGTNTRLGYQGQWTDPATGKVTMGARTYDPTMGGFTSRDSWNNPPDPTAALNRYTYGNASPLNYTDTNGHWATGCAAGAQVGGSVGTTAGPPGAAAGGGLGCLLGSVINVVGAVLLNQLFTGGDTRPMPACTQGDLFNFRCLKGAPTGMNPAPTLEDQLDRARQQEAALRDMRQRLEREEHLNQDPGPGTVPASPSTAPTTASPATRPTPATRTAPIARTAPPTSARPAPAAPAQPPPIVQPAPPAPYNLPPITLSPAQPAPPPSTTPIPVPTDIINRALFDGIGTATIARTDGIDIPQTIDQKEPDKKTDPIPGPGPCPTDPRGISNTCQPPTPECAPQSAADDCEDDVWIYKAPPAGMGSVWMARGFQAADFLGGGDPYPDGNAYFAKDLAIARDFERRPGYQDGVIGVRIPRADYEAGWARFEAKYASDPGGTELIIPGSLVAGLNGYFRAWPI